MTVQLKPGATLSTGAATAPSTTEGTVVTESAVSARVAYVPPYGQSDGAESPQTQELIDILSDTDPFDVLALLEPVVKVNG